MSRELTREIRRVKRKSFPELKWVYVRGIYVLDNELDKMGGTACVESLLLKYFLIPNIGYARFILPKSMSSDFFSEDRKGIIVHELSHLVVNSEDERKIDDEAISRGYVRELMIAALTFENRGLSRENCSYTSRELMDKLLTNV